MGNPWAHCLRGFCSGVLLALFYGHVPAGASLFILRCVIIAEVGRQLAFDPLLVALAAGMFVATARRWATPCTTTSSPALCPYTSCSLRWLVPRSTWMSFPRFGCRRCCSSASALAGSWSEPGPPRWRKPRKWCGALPVWDCCPQAGLALALALLFSRTFSEFGEQAGALILAIVAINEVVAPAFTARRARGQRRSWQGTPEPTDAYQPIAETDEMAPPAPIR